MSAPTPPHAYPPTVITGRPGTATAGAIIALVLSGLALAFSLLATIVLLSNRYVLGFLSFTGAIATAVIFSLIGITICAVGIAAAIQTLRNSNAWRITTVVLGFLAGGVALLSAIGNFNEQSDCARFAYENASCDSSSNTGGGVFLLLWSALAFASAILLLVNGANRFYASAGARRLSQGSMGQPVYAAPAAPVTTPAGWYPVDGGQLRWWDGTTWTNHFHTPG